MSFGFSVGDIASASKFAWQLYKSCKDSSEDFKSLAADVANLHVALRETAEVVACSEGSLRPAQKEELAAAGRRCSSILDAIDERLGKYESLGTQSQRAWDRVRWGMEDATALRGKLVSSTSVLTALHTSLSNASQVRIEKKLNQLLLEIRNGTRERSVMSISTMDSLPEDDKEAWTELRRDLEDIGIDIDLFMQHRKFIIQWLKDAIETGDLEQEAIVEDRSAASSLPTLVEASKESEPVLSKSVSITPDVRHLRESSISQVDTKRMSDPLIHKTNITDTRTVKSPTIDEFPRPFPNERPRETSKKRTVFKRALKGIGSRMSFTRECPDSPLRTPLSPIIPTKLTGQSTTGVMLPIPPLPPMPPLPLIEPNQSQWMQARTRSNTSQTMVARRSEGGGEIDITSGYSTRKGMEHSTRRSRQPHALRPHSESIPHQKPRTSDRRASSGKGRFDFPSKRVSKDGVDSSMSSKHQRESDLSTTRRPSEACSEQSTKRSSRTSGALSPYEKETFERHNATMKAYFERKPEHEAKIDAARRSLQIKNRLSDRLTAPLNKSGASGTEEQGPEPPPKDKWESRRHTQPPTAIKHLGTVPSVSSLGSDTTANGESGLLTIVVPAELLEAHRNQQAELDVRSGEQRLMDELTGPMKRFSINALQDNGDTYLLYAARKGFSDVVEYLLQNGADILMKNAEGQDALYAAVAGGHADTVRIILDSVPATSIPELWATSILHTAVKLNSIEIVQALLDNGADIGVRDADYRTAFEIASQDDLPAMARTLLEHATRISCLEAQELADEEEPPDESDHLGPAMQNSPAEVPTLV